MNTSLGKYYPVNSIIHKLDARVKIVLTILFLTIIFISKTFLGNFVSFLFILLVIFLSKIPIKFILKSFKGVFILLTMTFFLNLFLSPSGDVIFDFGILKLTTGGIYYSFRIFFRLCIIIVASFMLSFTTNTLDFADGFEFLLKPLKKIKFPAHEISMIITIALRFIPTILEELEKIKKAQISRGVDFENGNIIKKVKNFIPILIPLFLSSFKRAEDLAMAMEARCYRGDINRSKLKVLVMKKNDYIAIFIFIIYFITILTLRFTIEK